MRAKQLRGLSPVVATVVLVAAAIVIATMVVVWTSGYITQQTSQASTTGCGIQTSYSLENTVYEPSTGNLTAKLTNAGTRPVSNFSIDVELLNGTITTVVAENPAQTANVTAGQSAFLSARTGWNTTTGSPTIKSFRIRNSNCKTYFLPTEDFSLR